MYCWLAGLAAGCLLLLLSFSFFIFISFHFILSLISCHVTSGDEMDQYLKVDQWQDYQDHTAFGIEIDQNLRFQKG